MGGPGPLGRKGSRGQRCECSWREKQDAQGKFFDSSGGTLLIRKLGFRTSSRSSSRGQALRALNVDTMADQPDEVRAKAIALGA